MTTTFGFRPLGAAAPFRELATHRGKLVAVGAALETATWDAALGWRRVSEPVAGVAAEAFAPAWGGALHAVTSDGGVFAFDDTTWHRVAPASAVWKAPAFPLVAFDELRDVLVGWGSLRKGGARTNATYTFDGAAWTKVATAKFRPGDIGITDPQTFTLFWSARARAVRRMGKTQLAYFSEGTEWTSTILFGGEQVETVRRAVCVEPATAKVVIVNCEARTVVRIPQSRKIEQAGVLAPGVT